MKNLTLFLTIICFTACTKLKYDKTHTCHIYYSLKKQIPVGITDSTHNYSIDTTLHRDTLSNNVDINGCLNVLNSLDTNKVSIDSILFF